MTVRIDVKKFLLQNFLFTEDESALQDSESLMQRGIIDSTGILELMLFLEEKYNIKVADHEMIPENLDSIVKIEDFISRKLSVVA